MMNIIDYLNPVIHVKAHVHWNFYIIVKIRSWKKRKFSFPTKKNIITNVIKKRKSKISEPENQNTTITEMIKSTIS